jgi:hypothetical protein
MALVMPFTREDGSEGVYTEREEFLLRRALRRGTSSATMMAQAKSIEALVELNIEAPWDRLRDELLAILSDPMGTYQSGQASAKAQRLLEIIDRRGDTEWPSETPDAPVVDAHSYWPYRPGDPMEHDPFADLAQWQYTDDQSSELQPMTEGDRDQQRLALEGPPPWRRGEVRVRPEPGDPVED